MKAFGGKLTPTDEAEWLVFDRQAGGLGCSVVLEAILYASLAWLAWNWIGPRFWIPLAWGGLLMVRLLNLSQTSQGEVWAGRTSLIIKEKGRAAEFPYSSVTWDELEEEHFLRSTEGVEAGVPYLEPRHGDPFHDRLGQRALDSGYELGICGWSLLPSVSLVTEWRRLLGRVTTWRFALFGFFLPVLGILFSAVVLAGNTLAFLGATVFCLAVGAAVFRLDMREVGPSFRFAGPVLEVRSESGEQRAWASSEGWELVVQGRRGKLVMTEFCLSIADQQGRGTELRPWTFERGEMDYWLMDEARARGFTVRIDAAVEHRKESNARP